MQREWNPKSFFRQLTPEVITLFAERTGVALPEPGTGALGVRFYAAWKALPEAQQQRLEEELLPVNEMCSPHARPYLEEVARRTWTNGKSHRVEESRGWSAQDLALRLHLDDPRAFQTAYQDYTVDVMEHGKEYRGRFAVRVSPSATAKEQLREALEEHFRETAYGARCQVEDHGNSEKFALFVYFEDEVTPLERFVEEGTVATVWQRPVLKLAAVFHFDSATLQVKASRKAEREKLRDLFAEVLVGDRDYFEDASKSPRFSFAPLRSPTFRFATDPRDRIEAVSLVKVVARPGHPSARRIALDLVPSLSIVEVHEALESHGINAGDDAIEGVHLRFVFQGEGRSRTRTISLFNPNSTNLRDTARDRLIRGYLRAWGIDANVRKAAVAAPALQAAAV